MLRHLVLLLLAPFTLCALPDPVWPAAESDLPADPSIHHGELPNGVRFAVMPNAEPRDRISLRLVVRAGSLHERDEERGLAHFVEHMVFRGTKRHPNGSMATELQRRGIAFGPDNTAFTLPDYTIYHLELPDTRESTLRLGLEVFREYAEDVTFDAALIERERGVVLSELATRNTPMERAGRAHFEFLFPDSRQAKRWPIGVPETLGAFTRDQFVAFYDAWYRPERMAIVAVGELQPEPTARLIEEVFGSLRARAPVREETESAVPLAAVKPTIEVFSDPGLVGASCSILHPFPEPRTASTHERRVKHLHRGLAFAMFERRVARIANGPEGGFVSPYARVSDVAPGWAVASFGVSGTIADWKDFMSQLEREHRRAFLYGFTERELAATRATFATAYEESVRTRPTHPSPWIAGQLVNALVQGQVLSTPAALRDDMAGALAAATTADCLAAFREAWSRAAQHVFVVTHPQFSVAPQTIAQALNESRTKPVNRPVEEKIAEFAYTDFGPAQAPVKTENLPDLDVQQARFANGVRLNFKATTFEADSVLIHLRVGEGRLAQPLDRPGLDLLANQILPRGGLKRHTYEELQEICAGRATSISFAVDSDALVFSARCSRRDLGFCLQLITAHLVDAAYRPDAMREIQASFGSYFSALAAAPGGPISAMAERVLSGGDRRFGAPTYQELSSRTIAEASAWLDPQLKHGPIELSIVGDTSWDEASSAVGRTLGALGPRQERAVKPAKRTALPKPKKSGYVYTTPPELKQVALAWLCPAPELIDIYQDRRAVLLAQLIAEKMRVRLREELGATYNCTSQFVRHDGFPHLSYFMVYAEVDPAQARNATVLMKKELGELRKGRFTDDEFERVKAPFLRLRQDDLRHNTYWGQTVLSDAQENPTRLVAARDRTKDTAAITRDDLEKLAKRHLDPKRMFEFVAYPAPAKR